jgi:hypothetical protein
MATTNKLPTRNELVISALSKTDSKWYQCERKLQLHLLKLFEANRQKILDVFYAGFTKAVIKNGTCTNAVQVEFKVDDFKEEDRAGLFITQEMLADFGSADMVYGIYSILVYRECDTIKLLLEQAGFTSITAKGGFSNKGPNGKNTYAYIWSIVAM